MFDTTIIMVRHAQGEGNLKGEFHGQYPSDLTPLGFSQAECTAEYLKDFPIDIAFASDIPRAYTTAKIIAEKHGLEVAKEEGLREICGGVWETMKFDDIVVKYPEEYDIWKNDLGNCTCPGGESVRHLADRVQKCVERLVRENAGKTILMGTHATPSRVMGCVWKGLDITEIVNLKWVPNASVSIVKYDSETLDFEVVEYAYCEHLLKENLVTELPKNI
ncbi:MAG: histidine phosphatase family protein [Oscillospiraceae bacterium]|nr:histidine phosphatase family protein [Oscillospiraceae bacterium]